MEDLDVLSYDLYVVTTVGIVRTVSSLEESESGSDEGDVSEWRISTQDQEGPVEDIRH